MPPKKNKKTLVEREDSAEQLPKKRTNKKAAKPGDTKKAENKTKPISKEILKKKFLPKQFNHRRSPTLPIKTYVSVLNKKSLEDNFFECSLCYSTFIQPQLTECGHTYCKKCIVESLMYRTTCPICKADLKNTKFTNNFMINNLILEKLMTYENKKEYENLALNYEKWLTQKQVPLQAISQGISVDFRDKDYSWVPAKIIKLKQRKTLTLRYNKNGSTHSEVIPFGNERIAQPNTVLCLSQIRKVQNASHPRNNEMHPPGFLDVEEEEEESESSPIIIRGEEGENREEREREIQRERENGEEDNNGRREGSFLNAFLGIDHFLLLDPFQ